MKKHLQKAEVLQMLKHESEAYLASSRAIKLISMIVLREQFQFSKEDLRTYLDSFEDVLSYYNKSKDYKALLNEWDEFFEDEIGERILWKRERTT